MGLVFLMLMAHFAADVGWQPDHVVAGKHKWWQVMVTHSLCSCSLIGILGYFILGWPVVLLPWAGCAISHFVYDTCKVRLKLWDSMWLDQWLHVITIIFLFTPVTAESFIAFVSLAVGSLGIYFIKEA